MKTRDGYDGYDGANHEDQWRKVPEFCHYDGAKQAFWVAEICGCERL